MPGFTHLQTAQPITFGHHLLAYAEMFGRDRGRFADAKARLNESPLGAAALAGTGFAIDRDSTAKALGFARASANSLDAVSDRDFALETLAAASIAATHLSRLAEEIVMWTSPQFGFVRLSDKYTTGSSIMALDALTIGDERAIPDSSIYLALRDTYWRCFLRCSSPRAETDSQVAWPG